MFDASRFLRVLAFGLFLPCVGLAASTPPPNYQGLWWGSPAGSESGWGLNLSHQGDLMFATWFTYDGGGHHLWMAMSARKSADGSYKGSLYETMGPAFDTVPFDLPSVRFVTSGEASLSFRDADNGTFTYLARGVQQTKAITRQVFGNLPECMFGAQPNFATATNYTDLWWAGNSESGWGINLAHQDDVLFATWFTYDHDNSPLWLAVVAPKVASGVYTGSLIATSGPAFYADPFDAARVTRREVGTATFSFASGNAATFAFQMDGATRYKSITRQLLAPPAGTRCADPAAVSIKGKVFDPAVQGAIVCADANGNGRCDPGEVRAVSDTSGAYELALAERYDGPLAAEVTAGQAQAAGTPVARSYRLASPAREYSANITPFTTLVQLAHERDWRVAEVMVRNELGLPPAFAINLDAAPSDGTWAQVVSRSIVTALIASANEDYAAADALSKVVARFPAALTELPQLRILTKNGAPIVSKVDYVDATFTLNYPADALPQAALNGKIRGRGNVTWAQPKKPYKVQFTNDASYAKMADFLGMKKNRNWALLADYLDRTLMRNKLVFTLGNSSLFADGLKWTSSGQHLEVWLNGDYVGVYLLTEDIRIDAARLAIRKMSSNPSANQVDGGFIVEVDVPLDCYNDGVTNLQHSTPQSVHVCVKSPDEGDGVTPAQLSYMKGLLDSVETDLYASAKIDRLNPVSFADWYIMNEFFRNQDAAFYSSDYLWKDTAGAVNPIDRLLNMGPLWDFDITAGNTNNYDAWMPMGCWVTQSRDYMPNWYTRLFDNRDFLDLTLARWKQKRPALEKLVNTSIDAFARRLDAAQQRNFARWPIMGVRIWIDYWVFPTYADNVAYLKDWLGQRMAWLDRAMANPDSFTSLCR